MDQARSRRVSLTHVDACSPSPNLTYNNVDLAVQSKSFLVMHRSGVWPKVVHLLAWLADELVRLLLLELHAASG